MNPYPLERPVSVSIMSCMCSILPKGSKILRSMSSVMLKCKEPTYNRMGPLGPLVNVLMAGMLLPAKRFFSACVGCTTIGTPQSFCPVKAIACKPNNNNESIKESTAHQRWLAKTYQGNRFRIGKLDVAQSFEAASLVAGYESHITNLFREALIGLFSCTFNVIIIWVHQKLFFKRFLYS